MDSFKGSSKVTDNIKFKYDAVQGVFEYEGSHELLESTLSTLKDSVSPSLTAPHLTSSPTIEHASSQKVEDLTKNEEPPKKPKPKKKNTGGKPKFNADLDLLKLGDFYDNLVLKNNSEYIVAFLVFLTEDLKLEEVFSDDVFTCFDNLKAKLKTPGVKKALDNAKNLNHFIDYDRGYKNIRLTTKGSNFYHHDIIKRKET